MTSILKVSEIQDPTNSNTALTIDANGVVSSSSQPIFFAYKTIVYNANVAGGAELTYDAVDVNVGSHYNNLNGRFLAPKTGIYEFGYNSIASNAATTYRYDIRLNGSAFSGGAYQLRLDQVASSGEYASNAEYCAYINLTAGDYVSVWVQSDSGVTSLYNDPSYRYMYFRGRFIQ